VVCNVFVLCFQKINGWDVYVVFFSEIIFSHFPICTLLKYPFNRSPLQSLLVMEQQIAFAWVREVFSWSKRYQIQQRRHYVFIMGMRNKRLILMKVFFRNWTSVFSHLFIRMFHEILHDTEKEIVMSDMGDWVQSLLGANQKISK
jgi:hypothetical protein